jgi:radical SAM superfamily enzyme YgiQ (UPF0313 family)
MKVLLVYPQSREDMWCQNRSLEAIGKKYLGPPPIGLITVAALLPQDWEFTLVDMNIREITEEDWNTCECLLLSGMAVHFSNIVRIMQEAKERGKTVVIGGPLVFHGPQEALRYGADIVVKGEAEVVIDQVVEAIEEGKSGIVIEAKGRADMAKSPIPRYDLVDIHKYLLMGVQTSRGCPFRCEFCDITLMLGRQMRTKSIEQVLEELQQLYDLGWRRYVFMVDDNFIGHRSRARKLLQRLGPWMKERKYPFEFIMYATLNLAKDPEMMDLMVDAGCVKVLIGVEDTERDILKFTKKFQNAVLDIDMAVQKINRAGMQVLAHFIMGFDHERPGVDKRLIGFANRNQVPEVPLMLLQVGPGTELWDRLQREGRLLWDGPNDDLGTTTGMIKFIPTRPIKDIVHEYINVYETLYDPDAYLERTFEHFSRMAPPPYRKRIFLGDWPELRAAPTFLRRHSAIYSSRWKFFRFMIKAFVKFPARFRDYILTCAAGEQYASYRHKIRDLLLAQLEEIESSQAEGTSAKGSPYGRDKESREAIPSVPTVR